MAIAMFMEQVKKRFKNGVQWLTWSGVLAMVSAGGWVVYDQTQNRQANPVDLPVVSVERGTIETTINESGTLELGGQQTLKSPAEGAVEQVLVRLGNQVIGPNAQSFEGRVQNLSPIATTSSENQSQSSSQQSGQATVSAKVRLNTPSRKLIPGSLVATLQVGSISRAVIARQMAERDVPQVTVFPESQFLRLEDMKFLQKRLLSLQVISVSSSLTSSQTAFQDEEAKNSSMLGVSENFLLTSGKQLVKGRFFTRADFANYRRSQEQVKIEQLSLKSAQELLEINRALIEAGRLAPVDIIQSQTAIANRQVSLVAAQNNLESTKLALLQILDINRNTNIVAAEVPKALPVTLDANKLRQLALENQSEYLQAQLNLDKTKLDLLQAKNNRRWDLGLNISYDNTGDNATPDVRAGLTFGKTLGDLTPEQRFQRSRVNQLQAENNLKDRRESLEIQVMDGIRDVNLSFKQVELARLARESSEKQLEIEREKQRLGRGSGVFEIVSLENSLVEARNAELNATIEYLNALTNLDKVVGTTLNTWQVRLEVNKG